jgi:site-specific recombinase XerC
MVPRTSGKKGAMKRESEAAWWERLDEKQREAVRKWREDHRFHPHQIRHTFATEVRRQHGLEAAQVLLGHRQLSATQIYAEKDVEAARKIALKRG